MKRKPFVIVASVVLALIIGISTFLIIDYTNTDDNEQSGIRHLVSSIKDNVEAEKPKDNISDFDTIHEDLIESEVETVTDAQGNLVEIVNGTTATDSKVTNSNGKVVSVENETEIQKYLRRWATNSNQNVKTNSVNNVLMVCKDSTGPRKTDAIFILSANETDKKIFVTPLLEVSYTYYSSKKENKYDTFGNIFYNEGLSALTAAVENDFKIDIDNSVVVQIEGVVDVVNGYGGITIDGTSMDGRKTLDYLRSSSVSSTERVRRQSNVLSAIIKKVQQSPTQNTTVGTKVLKYYSSSSNYSSLIKLMKRMSASEKNYYTYKVESILINTESHCRKTDKVKTSSGTSFVYIIDYAKCAYDFQRRVYGTSIIQLSASHKHPIELI